MLDSCKVPNTSRRKILRLYILPDMLSPRQSHYIFMQVPNFVLINIYIVTIVTNNYKLFQNHLTASSRPSATLNFGE